MKILLRLIPLVFGLMSTSLLAATGISVDWNHPTQRADGTPLEEDNIAYYTIFLEEKDGASLGATKVDFPATSAQVLFEGEFGKIYCVGMTTTDITGLESARSDSLCLTWVTPTVPGEVLIPVSPSSPGQLNIKIMLFRS